MYLRLEKNTECVLTTRWVYSWWHWIWIWSLYTFLLWFLMRYCTDMDTGKCNLSLYLLACWKLNTLIMYPHKSWKGYCKQELHIFGWWMKLPLENNWIIFKCLCCIDNDCKGSCSKDANSCSAATNLHILSFRLPHSLQVYLLLLLPT